MDLLHLMVVRYFIDNQITNNVSIVKSYVIHIKLFIWHFVLDIKHLVLYKWGVLCISTVQYIFRVQYILLSCSGQTVCSAHKTHRILYLNWALPKRSSAHQMLLQSFIHLIISINKSTYTKYLCFDAQCKMIIQIMRYAPNDFADLGNHSSVMISSRVKPFGKINLSIAGSLLAQ